MGVGAFIVIGKRLVLTRGAYCQCKVHKGEKAVDAKTIEQVASAQA